MEYTKEEIEKISKLKWEEKYIITEPKKGKGCN